MSELVVESIHHWSHALTTGDTERTAHVETKPFASIFLSIYQISDSSICASMLLDAFFILHSHRAKYLSQNTNSLTFVSL